MFVVFIGLNALHLPSLGVSCSSSSGSSSAAAGGDVAEVGGVKCNVAAALRVRTLYACVGENETELTFEPNQIITNGETILFLTVIMSCLCGGRCFIFSG